MDCVILAGGLGTRMRPATELIPKALIPVNGRPFVDLQLEWLASEGVTHVVFCVGYKGDMLRVHVGDGRRFGLSVAYVDEGEQLRGTGGGLRLAADLGALPSTFLLLYGDSYLPVPIGSVWRAFADCDAPALMTVLRNKGRWEGSNARYADGRVEFYDKAASGRPGFEYIDYGLGVLGEELVREQIPPGQVFDLAVLYRDLSLAGRLAGYEVHERFYEVGSPTGLADLEAFLLKQATDG